MSGCTGAPDREQEALDIRDRIAAMPGVEDVDLIYDNGILEGTRFVLARSTWLRPVMSRSARSPRNLIAPRGGDFAKFSQRMEILVPEATSVSRR